MAEGKVQAVHETPMAQIKDAMARYPEVLLRLKRQNSKGQWATVASDVRKPTAELASLTSWITQMAGGGKFRIEVYNPADPTSDCGIPPWYEEIEAPPMPPVATQEEFAHGATPGAGQRYLGRGGYQPAYSFGGGMAGATGPAGYPQPTPPRPQAPSSPMQPTWGAGLPPSQARAFYEAQNPGYFGGGLDQRVWGGAKHTPDEAFAQVASQRERELQQMRDEHRREKEKLEGLIAQLNATIQSLRDDLSEERRRAEQQMFQMQIEMLKGQQNQRSNLDLNGIAAIAAGVAPIFTGLFQTSAQRQQAQTEASQRFMEMQMGAVNAMMTASLTKKDDGFEKTLTMLLPLIQPVLQEWMHARSPQAQAKLIETMSDQQMTFLGMAAQMVQAQIEAEGETPKWYPILQEILGSAINLGQAYFSGQTIDKLRSLPPDQARKLATQMGLDPDELGIGGGMAAPRLPTQVAPVAPAQQSTPVVTESTDAATAKAEQERLHQASQVVAAVLRDERLPQFFRSQEWEHLLLMIHAELDVEETARALADHLDALHDAGILPTQLELPDGGAPINLTTYSDDPTVLGRILHMMPITQKSPAYVQQLLEALGALYVAAEEETEEEQPPAPVNGRGQVIDMTERRTVTEELAKADERQPEPDPVPVS